MASETPTVNLNLEFSVVTDELFAALCREDRGVRKTSSPETMQLQRRSVNLKAGVKHFSEFFIIVAHFVFKTF